MAKPDRSLVYKQTTRERKYQVMSRLRTEPSCSSDLGANVPETFEHLLKSESELATAVAAIKTLMIVLEKCSAKVNKE